MKCIQANLSPLTILDLKNPTRLRTIILSQPPSFHRLLVLSKMAKEKEVSGKLEWRVNVPDGTSRVLVPESELGHKAWLLWLKGLFYRPISKIWRFLDKSWNLGVAEPKKVIHGAKVGLALLIVSIFYYNQNLYDGVGGYATWAIMTIVVVFESNVG